MRRNHRMLLLLGALAALVAVSTPANAQTSEPPPPPEANDDCTGDQDPTPVVIVHGTFANRTQAGSTLSPELENEGYCVFALNYGNCSPGGSCGRGPIEDSARELRRFINQQVLPESRSGKVSIVGHSQGGLMPRYYIRFLGGKSKVKDMIGLSPSNHGTDNPFAPPAGELAQCRACEQQFPYKSNFIRRVNQDNDTLGDIDYTQIQTRFDEVVVPYFSAYLADKTGHRQQPAQPAPERPPHHQLLPAGRVRRQHQRPSGHRQRPAGVRRGPGRARPQGPGATAGPARLRLRADQLAIPAAARDRAPKPARSSRGARLPRWPGAAARAPARTSSP